MKTHVTPSPWNSHDSLVGHEIILLDCYVHFLKVGNRTKKNRLENIRTYHAKFGITSWNLFEFSVRVPDWCKRIFMVCQKVQNTNLAQLPYFSNEGSWSPGLNLSSQEYTASWFRSQIQTIQSKHRVHLFYHFWTSSQKCPRWTAHGVARNIPFGAMLEPWWTVYMFC